jgi:hypothetical protein
MSEGDAEQAKAQGKTCCSTKKCKGRGDCGGQQCCIGPMGDGVCRSQCDFGNTTQTCSTDADSSYRLVDGGTPRVAGGMAPPGIVRGDVAGGGIPAPGCVRVPAAPARGTAWGDASGPA